MAVTQNSYVGDGTEDTYSFTFPYLKSADIKAQINASDTTAFTLPTATTLKFNTVPDSGDKIKIYRKTDDESLTATFYAGSSLKSEDLNDNFTQNLYTTQEVNARYLSNLGGTMVGDLAMGEDAVITFEGATDNAHETTVTVADPTADRTITIPNETGTVVTTGSSGVVTSTMITDATIVNGDIANTTITGGKLVNDTITATQIAANAVTASELADDAVDRNAILNDAVNGTKIADDSIDSEHYVDLSIDLAHLAANSVDTTKIVDGTIVNADISNSAAIAGSKLAADSIGATQITDNSITATQLAADSVGASELANNAVASANIIDDSIVNADINSSAAIGLSKLATGALPTGITVATGNIVDGTIVAADIANDAIDSQHYAAASIDNEHLADDAVGADELAANAVVNASVASGAAIEHAKLAAVSSGNILVGNGSNQAASVAMSGDVAIAAGGATTIQANSVEIGMIGCEQTTISDSDSHIPTSGAVVDYVAAQIAPIGGLEVIADDESFPNTIPNAGVVISISDCAGLSVNSSGVSTNADTLDNSTVTINGFPSELRGGVGGNADPYVFASGAGLMVKSTGSSQTYDYHQALIREADFVQLSDDINDFNSRYRIGTRTADNSNTNDDGDLFFDTGTNKMYVYDGAYNSGGSWKEVTSAGDYKLLTLKDNGQAHDGNLNLNGTNDQFDLFDGTSDASITSAGQLIVVLNGVVQKPNASWSDGGEGFALDGSDGIRFCDPPPNGSVCFVTQIGTATTLSVPADNSVSQAKIQNGAVDTAQLAADAVDGTKIEDNAVGAEHIEVLNSHLQFADDARVRLGTGNDLQLWHSSGQSHINNAVGNLTIDTENNHLIVESNSGTMAKFSDELAVELYFDGNKKFETTSTGVNLTDQLTVQGNINAVQHMYFPDNKRAYFGTGNDLSIFHTGSDAYIKNSTGNIHIEAKDGEDAITINPDGAVELYYDNSLKARTQSWGFELFGNIHGDDDIQLNLGTSNDLQIYHTAGSDSFIKNVTSGSNLQITSVGEVQIKVNSTENAIECNANGSVDIFYDNAKKFETLSNGVKVTGNIEVLEAGSDVRIKNDGGKLVCGAGDDLQIYHDGSNNNSYIKETNASGHLYVNGTNIYLSNAANDKDYITCVDAGAVTLKYDNATKFATHSAGCMVTGNIYVNDGNTFTAGNDNDLAFYHDAGSSKNIIDSASTNLEIRHNAEKMITCMADAQVILYFDNSKKFETISDGVLVTGHQQIHKTGGGGGAVPTSLTKANTYLHLGGNEYGTSNNGFFGIGFGFTSTGNANCRAYVAFRETSHTGYTEGDLVFEVVDGTTDTSSTEHFRIAHDGTLTATDTSIGSNSDQRLKTNINDFTYDLAKFKQFKPKTFDWKNPGGHGNKTGQRGFIAQDIEPIDNYLVGECLIDDDDLDRSLVDSDGKSKTSKLGKNDAMYISVIQQLITKIEDLETRIATLEAG